MGKSESGEILKQAQELYNKGDRQKAINLLMNDEGEIFPIFAGDELAEAEKTIGLCLYYIAIKDFREIEDRKIETCAKAELFLRSALENTDDKDIRISAINFLPLVLWIQGKHDEAWQVSNSAISEFGDVPSIWNTSGILCNWSKQYEKSIEVFKMVYETALNIKDYRTAGHGKHNQGDAFEKLSRKEEAKEAYEEAKELYSKFEKESGQKATVHITGVSKKIALLIMVIAIIICPKILNINYGVLAKNIFVEAPSFFIQKVIK